MMSLNFLKSFLTVLLLLPYVCVCEVTCENCINKTDGDCLYCEDGGGIVFGGRRLALCSDGSQTLSFDCTKKKVGNTCYSCENTFVIEANGVFSCLFGSTLLMEDCSTSPTPSTTSPAPSTASCLKATLVLVGSGLCALGIIS